LDVVVIAASVGIETARGEIGILVFPWSLQLVQILGWKEMPSSGVTYFVFCSAFTHRNFCQNLIKAE